MIKLEMLLVRLFTFYALAVSETWSCPALTFESTEGTGFFQSNTDGPSVHLPSSEVALKLCFCDSPPELMSVRFGDGKSLNNFPIKVENHDSSTANRSPKNNSAETFPQNGTMASCPTVIRHSYANPGLYRIEAEAVRPRNLNLTFSPTWLRISYFESLVGQVLIFSHTDRLLTLETAHFLAVVRDVQLSLVAEVDFGDNTPTKVIELYKSVSVPEWVPKVPWYNYRAGTCDHAYAYSGTYTITLRVSRYPPVKGTVETEVVIAQTTLTIETFAQMIGDHLLFYQPDIRTFPRENFEAVAMVERLSSENIRVDLDFGDGSPPVSAQLEKTTPRPEWTLLNETDHYYSTLVKHRFSLSGAFQMKMIVSRTDLSESRVVFFCPVVVYDFRVDVKDVRLQLPIADSQVQNKVTTGESVTFMVLVRSRPEADLEILVDFGDGAERQKINYTTVALASLPNDALYDLPDANHVGFAHHTYSIKGTFEAKAAVTNTELKRFHEATFTAGTIVRVMTCSSLPVWIGGTGVQRIYGRWEEVALNAYVAPGCEDETGAAGGRLGGGKGEGGEDMEGRVGREGGDTDLSSEIKEEALGAGKVEEKEEGRGTEGISERGETGKGGEGGGDGGGRGGGRIAKRLLAEWRIIQVGTSSVAGAAWMTYPKSSGFEIRFPPYSLPVGEYEYQIELTRLRPDDSTPIERTMNRTKVIVSSMDFKVDVEPETQRIDLTTGSVAVFKAMIVPEMDWDDMDQTIVYEWFCVTQKPSSDDSHIPDDSGCYGDKSKIDGTTSMLEMEPKSIVFNELPAVFYVYARATRFDRTVTSHPAEVWLDALPDLNITVVCFINCDRFLSANDTLTLSYTCSNCNRLYNPFPQLATHSSAPDSYSLSSSGSSPSSFLDVDRNLNFSWTIEPSGTGIDLLKKSLTGSNSDWLIIPGLAFYESLTADNQTHHIKLTVADRLRSQGSASYRAAVTAGLKPSFLTKDDPSGRGSSILVLSQRHLLFCVIVAGIIRKITSLPHIT